MTLDSAWEADIAMSESLAALDSTVCEPPALYQLVLHELDIEPHGRNNKKIAFGWYGGKYSHLAWLLPLLPAVNHFCEPFGGSAAVLLNREPSPVETYNDLDGEVVNFFRVLRVERDALVEAIAL